MVRLSKPRAKPVFQRLDMVAHHGGGHVEAAAGGGKPAAVHHPNERCQTGQPIHRQPPIIRSHWIMLPVFSGLSHRRRHCIFAADRRPPEGRAKPDRGCHVDHYLMPLKPRKISLRPSRQAIRRAALALALALGVAGAGHFGYGYLTTGRYLESTDDAYVKADYTIIAPKVSGYIAGCWSATTSRSRPARCSPGSTIAISGSRWTRPRPTSPPPKPRCAISMRRSPAAAGHRAAHGRRRRRRGQPEIRAGRTGPLRRADEDRLRHRAARAADRRGAARQDRAVAARKSGLLAAQRKVDVLTTERAKAVAQLDRARAVEARPS